MYKEDDHFEGSLEMRKRREMDERISWSVTDGDMIEMCG